MTDRTFKELVEAALDQSGKAVREGRDAGSEEFKITQIEQLRLLDEPLQPLAYMFLDSTRERICGMRVTLG